MGENTSMNRVGRREFWGKILLTSGLSFVSFFGVKCLEEEVLTPPALQVLYILYMGWLVVQLLILFGVSIPLTIWRLHDVGRSGWWLLGGIALDNLVRNLPIPAAKDGWCMLPALLVLGFWPGDREENAYGPPSELPASGLGHWGLVVRNRFCVKLIALSYALLALLAGLVLALVERP